MFHVMERASARGQMDFATPCQLCVNVDKYRGFWLRSAMVQINNHAAWTNPMYHVNRMYSRLRQPNLLATSFENSIPKASVAFDGYEFPAVDVIATGSEDGRKVVIKISNNSEEDFDFRFALTDFAGIGQVVAHEVSAASILDMNSQFTPDTVAERVDDLPAGAGGFDYRAVRNSVTLLEVSAK